MIFSCSGGGHIGLFTIRPPGGHLNLYAMVLENLVPIPIPIPNFENLSPSARFYELVPCYFKLSEQDGGKQAWMVPQKSSLRDAITKNDRSIYSSTFRLDPFE